MRRRLRRLVALSVITVAGFATIATSPGPGPALHESVTFPIELSAVNPVVARRVTVNVDRGGSPQMGAYLSVFGSEQDAGAPSPLWVSMIPTDPSEALDTPGEFGGYAEHFLDEYCKNECERSYVVVARLVDPATAVSTDITVDLSAPYSNGMPSPRPPAGMSLGLTLDPDPVQASASLRSTQSGVLELATGPSQANGDRFVDTWTGELRVSPEASSDSDGLGFPLAGRIAVHGTTSAQDRDASADLALRIDDLWLATGYPSVGYPMNPMETDWLRLCPSGDNCVLPVELELQGDQSLGFEFEVVAELLYLDGAAPPPGAELTLEAN